MVSWKYMLFWVTIFHVVECLSVPLTESCMHTQRDYGEGSSDINNQISLLHSLTVESNVHGSFEATSISLPSYQNSLDFAHVDSSIYANEDQERNLLNLVGDFESITTKSCNSFSTKSEQVQFLRIF